MDFISTPKNGWYSLRWFKDAPEIPDNTWTILYDWSSTSPWAWVFYNSVLWLISISWNGTTWYTIADKNVWATTVYNSWDALSEANCGKFFQRWNNYWFPWTWTITTSATKIDATNYWPWNYYSSSAFITWSSGWDSSNNSNLRWWETWIQTLTNAITNKWVLSVNGQTGDVVIDEWNTKTFYISSTSDLTNAQAAYDWYVAGKNPIIFYNETTYILAWTTWKEFISTSPTSSTESSTWTKDRLRLITLTVSWSTVTTITASYKDITWPYLKTNYNYSYTPTYDWSPATKKYVDDNAWIPNDTTWTTSTMGWEWVWTKAEFNALSSYWNKIYNIIE